MLVWTLRDILALAAMAVLLVVFAGFGLCVGFELLRARYRMWRKGRR